VARWVLHVDLDQFIAAVEVLRHPELRGRPVVVGGDGDPTKRGVVSTASYEAREHGVHSGLPLRPAARRLPDAVFLPVDRAAYEEVSETVMAVLRSTGAVVEVLGWDEAFLGVEVEDPEGFARSLARSVRSATQLDCTVGIGENKLQAKIATGFGKPAGVFRLTFSNWFEVLGGRPTDALWGIGAKTAKKLAGLGIRTVSDLAAADPDALAAEFGPMTGPWLVLLGRGRGDADVDDSPYLARGHGREETFQRNIADWTAVQAEVTRIAGLLAADLASEPRPAVRVIVKVRYAPFITETHGVTLASPSSDASVILQAASEALGRFTGRRPVRLLGMRAEFESGGARLQWADHADFREVRLGWQRLALAGEREAAALVEREGALVALSQPKMHRCGTPGLGPVDHRVHERLADAQATRLRPHPQRDEFHRARLLLGGADESGRLGFVDFGDIGKERSSPRDPASPIPFDRCGLLGVSRPEGVRRVPQSG
jgi:DNA polymerase-4